MHCAVTGHADGTVRFWDLSCTNMHHLYRLRTQKLFEKNKAGGADLLEEVSRAEVLSVGTIVVQDPYAITNLALSTDCSRLVVTGQTDQVTCRNSSNSENYSQPFSLGRFWVWYFER